MLTIDLEAAMTEQQKLDDKTPPAKPSDRDPSAEADRNDVPLVGKTEEIDPATVDSMIEDRFEATDN